jgi:hypothetical protein
MYWIHPAKRRYYRVQVLVDLFGTRTLVCSWGSLDSCRGNWSIRPIASDAALAETLQAVARRRASHGYVLHQG